jgi:hypothetical protein
MTGNHVPYRENKQNNPASDGEFLNIYAHNIKDKLTEEEENQTHQSGGENGIIDHFSFLAAVHILPGHDKERQIAEGIDDDEERDESHDKVVPRFSHDKSSPPV